MTPLEIDETTQTFIGSHRVGHLATADAAGRPLVVPVCFVLDRGSVYSALDRKPKSVALEQLRRVKNIRQNPKVSLVIDDYSDDWSRLAYVLIDGTAEVIMPGHREHSAAVGLLREKYPQYRSMPIHESPMIKIIPERVQRWHSQRD